MKNAFLSLILVVAIVPSLRVQAQVAASQTAEVRPNITLVGEISKPGVYRLLPQETLPALLKRVGKLDSAAREILVSREGVSIRIDLPNAAKFVLRDGDTVLVPKQLRRVQIIGAVKSPGNYEFPDAKGVSVRALLEMAGGLNVDASKFNPRISVARRNAQGRLEIKERFLLPADAAALDASALLQDGESVIVTPLPIEEFGL